MKGYLTRKDVENIVVWRNEVIQERTEPIYLNISPGTIDDPLTGEKVALPNDSYEVQAVVTERSSRTIGERNYRNRDEDYASADIEGDLWMSVSMDEVNSLKTAYDDMTDTKFLDMIKTVEYDGEEYVVVGTDRKGLGRVNRVEILAKRAI